MAQASAFQTPYKEENSSIGLALVSVNDRYDQYEEDAKQKESGKPSQDLMVSKQASRL